MRLTRSRRLAVTGAVVLVLVAVGIAALSTREHEPARPPVLRSVELQAEDFLDSIGVVVHFNYVDTSYGARRRPCSDFASSGCATSGTRCRRPCEPLGGGTAARRVRRASAATLATGDVNRDPEAAVADSLVVIG